MSYSEQKPKKRSENSQTESLEPLEKHEQVDARRREAPSAAIVYEAIRHEAEMELRRPLPRVAWSAFAAGLSMGFSFIAQALLITFTPDASWQPVISSFGYSVGFLFVILGRQQLFTENTLTPILEVFRRRDEGIIKATLSVWAVVLIANMCGTATFAAVLSYFNVLDSDVRPALATIAAHEFESNFGTMFVRAIFAGWLVALMLWILPFAETARVAVIIIVTYVIGLAQFPHIVAGSVAGFYAVFQGTPFSDFGLDFFIPTILGNMCGGILLVAAVNYAQVAYRSNSKRRTKKPE